MRADHSFFLISENFLPGVDFSKSSIWGKFWSDFAFSTKDFVKISSEFVCQVRKVRRFPVILCFPPKAAEIFGQPGRFLKDFFKKMMKNL